MREASTYRTARRKLAQETGEPMVAHARKVKAGKRARWLARNPKLANFYGTTLALLSTGPRATPPKWKAIRKMMAVVATSPRINMIGVGIVPYLIHLGRHERGSWRSFPHVTIDANLKVPS